MMRPMPLSLSRSLAQALESHGVRRSDPRIKKMADELKDEDVIFFERFQELLLDHAMVDRVLKGRVAIQDFRSFTDSVRDRAQGEPESQRASQRERERDSPIVGMPHR